MRLHLGALVRRELAVEQRRSEAAGCRRRSWQKSLQLLLRSRRARCSRVAHGAQLERKRRGDLVIGETFEIAQHHSRYADPRAARRWRGAAPLSRSLRSRSARGLAAALAGSRSSPPRGRGTLRPSPEARRLRQSARGDRIEPGRELGVPAKVGQSPMRPEKRLLGHLLGFGRAAQHPYRHAEHSMLIGLHEPPRRPGLSRARSRSSSSFWAQKSSLHAQLRPYRPSEVPSRPKTRALGPEGMH